jgi:hypothetical protein
MRAAKPVVYVIDGDGSKDVITGRTGWLNTSPQKRLEPWEDNT